MMADTKKTIIVENVLVKGYIKHANGKKTMFEFNRQDFTPSAFERIFEEVGKKF
jgi:hypothetical protein